MAAHQSFRTSRSEELRDKYNLVYHGALKSINKEVPNTVTTFYVSKSGCWGFILRCVISVNSLTRQFSFFWAGSSNTLQSIIFLKIKLGILGKQYFFSTPRTNTRPYADLERALSLSSGSRYDDLKPSDCRTHPPA